MSGEGDKTSWNLPLDISVALNQQQQRVIRALMERQLKPTSTTATANSEAVVLDLGRGQLEVARESTPPVDMNEDVSATEAFTKPGFEADLDPRRSRDLLLQRDDNDNQVKSVQHLRPSGDHLLNNCEMEDDVFE